MTRTEMYDYIRKNNLQDEVKKVFGKNFTNVKTALLENYITTIETANQEACKGKCSDKESNKKCECTESYEVLANKYNTLLGAVVAMMLSLNEEVSKDVAESFRITSKNLCK